MGNTEFWWQKHLPRQFAGLEPKDLKFITGIIGAFIGITPEEAKKIQVIFGDHIVINHPDGIHINTGACISDVDESKNITGCRVIINRSKEVCLFAIDHADERNLHKMNDIVDKENGNDSPSCNFESPWENVIWLITEELKHAQLRLRAGSNKTMERWQDRFKLILTRKGKRTKEEYATDIEEVAVSRLALRVLEKFSEVIEPHRAIYFNDLYKQSIMDSVNVIPNVKDTLEDTYINTGFKPN